MAVKIHRLKTREPFFSAVRLNVKTAEIRLNDRDYQKGDYLILSRAGQWLLKHEIVCQITHVVTSEQFPEGLQPGYCLLSFRHLPRDEEETLRRLVEPHDCCSPCSDPKCPWVHHAPLKPEEV